jgi:hypothetical protein
VDGGYVDNVPADIMRERNLANIIIAGLFCPLSPALLSLLLLSLLYSLIPSPSPSPLESFSFLPPHSPSLSPSPSPSPLIIKLVDVGDNSLITPMKGNYHLNLSGWKLLIDLIFRGKRYATIHEVMLQLAGKQGGEVVQGVVWRKGVLNFC